MTHHVLNPFSSMMDASQIVSVIKQSIISEKKKSIKKNSTSFNVAFSHYLNMFFNQLYCHYLDSDEQLRMQKKEIDESVNKLLIWSKCSRDLKKLYYSYHPFQYQKKKRFAQALPKLAKYMIDFFFDKNQRGNVWIWESQTIQNYTYLAQMLISQNLISYEYVALSFEHVLEEQQKNHDDLSRRYLTLMHNNFYTYQETNEPAYEHYFYNEMIKSGYFLDIDKLTWQATQYENYDTYQVNQENKNEYVAKIIEASLLHEQEQSQYGHLQRILKNKGKTNRRAKI